MFNLESWSNEFFAQAKTPMTQQQSQVFMNMFLSEGHKQFSIPEIESSFMYQVIDKRSEFMGLELSKPTKMFLMFLSESPGTAVMYLSAIRQKTNQANMETLTTLFPSGFVSNEMLESLWDKQKGFANEEKVDNCLDNVDFSQVQTANKKLKM